MTKENEKKETKILTTEDDLSKVPWEEYQEYRRLRHIELVKRYNKTAKGRKVAKKIWRKRKKDPEFREKMRNYLYFYRRSPEFLEKLDEYREKARESARKWYHENGGREKHLKYLQKPEVQQRERARQKTDEFREYRRKYQTSEEYKAYQREYKKRKRLEKKLAEERAAQGK